MPSKIPWDHTVALYTYRTLEMISVATSETADNARIFRSMR